jgi:hypothetical protein
MVSSAPIFYNVVVIYIDLVIKIVSVVVQGIALVHCLTQRGDGFTTLPKGAWVAIMAVCILLTVLLGSTGIFGLIGIGAALIYLLDVRAGLKDLSDGKGFW